MAIAYVGGQVGARAGSTSASTITYALTGGSDATPQAGDLVLITVGIASTARTPACAVTTPSGFTAYGQLNADGTSSDTHQDVQWKFMGGSPDASFDLPATGHVDDAQSYAVQVFRNVDAAVNDVASTTATGTGTGRCNPASITPVTAGAWPVICGNGAAATGATYTAPANYTTNFLTANGADVQDSMVGCGYRSDWTSGAEDPAVYGGGTTGASHSWVARTIVLRPSSGAVFIAPPTKPVLQAVNRSNTY